MEKKENRLIVITDDNGKIKELKARCSGNFVIPGEQLILPNEDFTIDSHDVGILLAQYDPNDIFYQQDVFDGIYYMNKNNKNKAYLEKIIKHLEENQKDLELAENIADKRADALLEYERRFKTYRELFCKIPKWVRFLFFNKTERNLINQAEKEKDKYTVLFGK